MQHVAYVLGVSSRYKGTGGAQFFLGFIDLSNTFRVHYAKKDHFESVLTVLLIKSLIKRDKRIERIKLYLPNDNMAIKT